jgi:hypothetical protein
MNELFNQILELQKKEQMAKNANSSDDTLCDGERIALWDALYKRLALKSIPINELLAMAVFLDNNLKQLSYWKELRKIFPDNLSKTSNNIYFLYLDLAFNYVFDGGEKAFEIYIEKLIEATYSPSDSPSDEKISLPFNSADEFSRLITYGLLTDKYSGAINTHKIAQIILKDEIYSIEKIIVLLEIFGRAECGEAILKKIFEIIYICGGKPIKRFNNKNILYLQIIENWISIYIKRNELPELTAQILEKSSYVLKEISNYIYKDLNKFEKLKDTSFKNIKQFNKKNKIIVGFILHSGAYLAHTKNLISFLKGLNKDSSNIQPILIIFDTNFSFQNELIGLNIEVILIENNQNLYFDTIKLAVRNDLDLLVFVSVPAHLYFFSLFNKKLFKVVWWSMKYSFPILKNEIWHIKSGKIGLQEYTKIDDFQWRSASTSLMGLTERPQASEVANLKFKIKGNRDILILGVLGRAAKIRNPLYLKTIKNILNTSRNTVFVYTCEDIFQSEINNLINEYGDPSRMISLGWLKNTKIAASTIDIYLDSFPFASGHTAFETIALAKPVICLITMESTRSSLVTAFLDYINENNLEKEKYGLVEVLNEYISLACKIIEDINLRSQIGLTLKELLVKINPSSEESSSQIERHFLEIYYAKSPP